MSADNDRRKSEPQDPGHRASERSLSGEEPSLSSIRRILFASEKDRIDQLEADKARLEAELADLLARIDELQSKLADSEARLHDETSTLATEIDDVIARRAQNAPEEMAEAIGPVMASALKVQASRSRQELVDAVAPVLGDAIQVQIRESRQSLIDALYPIIGQLAQRYIGEFFRELQRNIDARLRGGFRPDRLARQTKARLSGVSPADLELRDSLPFSVREVFLIENESGLLMARSGSEEAVDSDLISGMLTAIRRFVHDSFALPEGPDPLDEIQYGDQRIIVREGRDCFLAVVIRGIEPPGFRAKLRNFVDQLHSEHAGTLRNYDGDSALLANIRPRLDSLSSELMDLTMPEEEPKPMTRGQKRALVLAGIGGILLVALACFYLQFTIALLPAAFGAAVPAPTATLAAVETGEPFGTGSLHLLDRPAHIFSEPNVNSSQVTTLRAGTILLVTDVANLWMHVEWQDHGETRQGWLPAEWLTVGGTTPGVPQDTDN